MRYVNIVFMLLICATAYVGDYIVFKSKYSSNQVFRAFADTSVHGAIGFWSALLFFSCGINVTTQAWLCNVLFCSAMSSLIDVDHFIVAKSFNLKDIANVNRRGIFHNTSFSIIVAVILLILTHISRKINLYLLTYMLILAFTSHHIRDGNRRGIWLYPYTHTQPLGKCLYVFLICLLPFVFAYTFYHTKPVFSQKVVQYGIV
ncbi:transmembrane protein 267 [Maniola hyperantus]|uniref:transmembrane protein 267 n=1 Tax=Aphantopus hyperantus TaxID=2795564 RepID=UPI00156943B8|nr:transmembrane protein 267 [Maniola hyperantus]